MRTKLALLLTENSQVGLFPRLTSGPFHLKSASLLAPASHPSVARQVRSATSEFRPARRHIKSELRIIAVVSSRVVNAGLSIFGANRRPHWLFSLRVSDDGPTLSPHAEWLGPASQLEQVDCGCQNGWKPTEVPFHGYLGLEIHRYGEGFPG